MFFWEFLLCSNFKDYFECLGLVYVIIIQSYVERISDLIKFFIQSYVESRSDLNSIN